MEQLYTLIGTLDGEVITTIPSMTLAFCEQFAANIMTATAEKANLADVVMTVECVPD